MCYQFTLHAKVKDLKKRFNAKFQNSKLYKNKDGYCNAFGYSHPSTPVITNAAIDEIQLFHWGLIPNWSKDNSIRRNTLNAKIETIHEKLLFSGSINHRCLVLVDGYTDFRWMDDKGKMKRRYYIFLHGREPFAFAGLWSSWTDRTTGKSINSYTIITTEANEQLSKININGLRMPVILTPENELDWLGGTDIEKFKKCEVDLITV